MKQIKYLALFALAIVLFLSVVQATSETSTNSNEIQVMKHKKATCRAKTLAHFVCHTKRCQRKVIKKAKNKCKGIFSGKALKKAHDLLKSLKKATKKHASFLQLAADAKTSVKEEVKKKAKKAIHEKLLGHHKALFKGFSKCKLIPRHLRRKETKAKRVLLHGKKKHRRAVVRALRALFGIKPLSKYLKRVIRKAKKVAHRIADKRKLAKEARKKLVKKVVRRAVRQALTKLYIRKQVKVQLWKALKVLQNSLFRRHKRHRRHRRHHKKHRKHHKKHHEDDKDHKKDKKEKKADKEASKEVKKEVKKIDDKAKKDDKEKKDGKKDDKKKKAKKHHKRRCNPKTQAKRFRSYLHELAKKSRGLKKHKSEKKEHKKKHHDEEEED